MASQIVNGNSKHHDGVMDYTAGGVVGYEPENGTAFAGQQSKLQVIAWVADGTIRIVVIAFAAVSRGQAVNFGDGQSAFLRAISVCCVVIVRWWVLWLNIIGRHGIFHPGSF